MAAKEKAHLIQDFLTKHDIPTAINYTLNQVLKLDPLPENPYDIISNVIRENNTKKGESPILTQFEAGIIIDEDGFFNIELKIYAQTSLHSKVCCLIFSSHGFGLCVWITVLMPDNPFSVIL